MIPRSRYTSFASLTQRARLLLLFYIVWVCTSRWHRSHPCSSLNPGHWAPPGKNPNQRERECAPCLVSLTEDGQLSSLVIHKEVIQCSHYLITIEVTSRDIPSHILKGSGNIEVRRHVVKVIENRSYYFVQTFAGLQILPLLLQTLDSRWSSQWNQTQDPSQYLFSLLPYFLNLIFHKWLPRKFLEHIFSPSGHDSERSDLTPRYDITLPDDRQAPSSIKLESHFILWLVKTPI